MSPLTDEHSHARKAPGPGKRVWQFLSIVLILLTPWVFYRDLKEAYITGVDHETIPKTFPARLKTAVEAQLAVLEGVDSGKLGFTYFDTLQRTECNWLFECHPIHVANPLDSLSAPILAPHSLDKGMEMALAPTTPKPAPPVSLPSFIKPHDMSGASAPSAPRSPDLLTPLLDSAKPSGPVPGESEADRVQREKIAQIQQNLKAGDSLSLPGKSGADASVSPANAVANPTTNPTTIPAPPLPHLPDLPSLSPTIPSAAPATETVATAPEIFTKLGPIRLPTLHTIRGTPHAFHQMVIAIHDKGFWAMTMYLSCTLIWITLWLRKMPLMLYILILGGPLSIPLMVTLMQWLCEGLLKLGLAGCAVAAGLMALLPSTALALLVGLHHAVKSPRELFEAVEHLKG